MDKEKQDWMKEVGIRELDKPYKYACWMHGTVMHYSEEYIENTSLDELKALYQRNIKHFKKLGSKLTPLESEARKMDEEFKLKANDLFAEIEKLSSTGITESNLKEIVVRLIDVLEEHNLTYDQAYGVLQVTRNTLSVKALGLKL